MTTTENLTTQARALAADLADESRRLSHSLWPFSRSKLSRDTAGQIIDVLRGLAYEHDRWRDKAIDQEARGDTLAGKCDAADAIAEEQAAKIERLSEAVTSLQSALSKFQAISAATPRFCDTCGEQKYGGDCPNDCIPF